LANNHIMDHGCAGLRTTLQTLNASGLGAVGAGENLAEADRWLVKTFGGLRVAFAAFCEREWCFAGPRHAGGAPLDLIHFTRLVAHRRGSYDVLVVLLHGGAEHVPLPSPRFQDTCRFLVEQGANAIICQHSHIAGAMEYYQGAPIVYGQGNLLALNSALRTLCSWHIGCLIRLEINPSDRQIVARRLPFVQSFDTVGVRGMSASERGAFDEAMSRLDQQVQDSEQVLAAWKEFCAKRKLSYYSLLKGHTGLVRRVQCRLGVFERMIPREAKRVWLNLLRCDAHHESLESILEATCGWPDSQTRKD